MNTPYGKWFKYKRIRRAKKLIPYLPDTRRMTKANLWDLMERYKKVVIKPSTGRLGNGVIKVGFSRYGNEIHYENVKKVLATKKATLTALKKRMGSRRYIVQQYIDLATIEGDPFDLRVMVQRRRNSAWTVTGKVARIASKGFFVTNVARKLLQVEEAIHRSPVRSSVSVTRVLKKLDRIALLTAKQMSKVYLDHPHFGLDIGLDKKGKLWLIEVNLKPDITQFKWLKNKSMYRIIRSFRP